MVPNLPEWKRIHGVFQRGLTLVEYAGLVVIGFATTYAMVEEVAAMIHAAKVTLADLLLMFIYLEVLAMVGQRDLAVVPHQLHLLDPGDDGRDRDHHEADRFGAADAELDRRRGACDGHERGHAP
jgi:hypothetical protein